ncbi:MAG: isoprenylcysteine carboxylmethyltransferase family protein [Gammaproteobacteria bacterium]
MKLIIPPPAQVAILAVIMWQISKLLPHANFLFANKKEIVIVGVAIALLITFIAAITLSRSRTTLNPFRPSNASSLVTHGIFRYSRNPIYVADFMFLLSWAAWLGNPVNLIALASFPIFITALQIKPEEEALLQLFGDEYLKYQTTTPRWLKIL